MRNHTPSGNEVSTRSEPYTAATREMRMVDPTLPRYGTDLMTLRNELLHTLSRWWDFCDFTHSQERGLNESPHDVNYKLSKIKSVIICRMCFTNNGSVTPWRDLG